MNRDLFERVVIQLHPDLAQEFMFATIEDEIKLKALEIIKEKPMFPVYVKTYKNAFEMVVDRPGFSIGQSVEELQKEFNILKEVLS